MPAYRKPSEVQADEFLGAADGAASVRDTIRRAGINPKNHAAAIKRMEFLGIYSEVKSLTRNGGKNDGGSATKGASAGVERGARRGNTDQGYSRTSHGTHDTIESRGPRIKTLGQLIEATGVDTSVWRVKEHTVNAWEGFSVKDGISTMFQVKARLEPIREAVDLRAMRDSAIAAMRAHSPAPVRRYKVKPVSDLLMEVMIPDLHLGALAHAEETGQNYDGKLAVAAFRAVFYNFMTRAQTDKVGRFVFPVGNDLLHVEGADNETSGGTPQDTDGRSYRSRERAKLLMAEAIDAMAQIAPVECVIVPGNHAREAEHALGDTIDAWYRLEGRVTVHRHPAPRKYIRHGRVLLGYTHGDGVAAKDLPLIMATEAAKDWAEAPYRSIALGHLHQRKKDTHGSVEEHKGVEVRISPSLKAADRWHSWRGLVGNLRAAEARVYSATQGEIARYTAVLPEDFDKNIA